MRLLVPAALFSALLAHAAHAQECGMPLRYYDNVPRVADIDAGPVRDALDAGDYAAVAKLARARLDTRDLVRRTVAFELGAGRKFNEEEVRAALAAAVIRTHGAEGLAETVVGQLSAKQGAAAHTRNLQQARDLLQQELSRARGDPVLATLLGEAHLALGDVEAAAGILEDLAGADLIVSPEGWAALAKTRALSGKGAEASAARARCQAAARDPAVCADEPVTAASS
jgi:predicted Zn-dependent protease